VTHKEIKVGQEYDFIDQPVRIVEILYFTDNGKKNAETAIAATRFGGTVEVPIAALQRRQ
jgi:hypothetical protein